MAETFDIHKEPVKVDSVYLWNYMFTKQNKNALDDLELKQAQLFSATGFDVHRRLKAAGALREDPKTGFVPKRHRWFIEKLDFLEKWGVTNIFTTYRDKFRERVPYIHVEMKKGDFQYYIQFHFDMDPVPRILFSGSLFCWAIGGYLDVDKEIDNGKEILKLIDDLDQQKIIIMKTLGLPFNPVFNFPAEKWRLARLDLAKDLELGLERCLQVFDFATTIKIPRFDTVPGRVGYRVTYYPSAKDYTGTTKKLLKWNLPRINFYHKSMELIQVVAPKQEISVPDGLIKRGICRLEIQAYHGSKVKNMAEGPFKTIRDGINRNEYVMPIWFEKAFQESDVLTEFINQRLASETCNTNSMLIRKILAYVKANNGAFSRPKMCLKMGLTEKEADLTKAIMKWWVEVGIVKYKGRVYECQPEFYNLIQRGELPKHA